MISGWNLERNTIQNKCQMTMSYKMPG